MIICPPISPSALAEQAAGGRLWAWPARALSPGDSQPGLDALLPYAPGLRARRGRSFPITSLQAGSGEAEPRLEQNPGQCQCSGRWELETQKLETRLPAPPCAPGQGTISWLDLGPAPREPSSLPGWQRIWT